MDGISFKPVLQDRAIDQADETIAMNEKALVDVTDALEQAVGIVETPQILRKK